MNINADNLRIELKPGLTLTLREAKHMRLDCLEGILWITQHHDTGDYLLQAGQSMEIRNNGAVIIHAWRSAFFAAQPAVQAANATWLKRLASIRLLPWLWFPRRCLT